MQGQQPYPAFPASPLTPAISRPQETPCQQLVFFLKDTSAADLRAIIEFIYKGSVNVAQSQLASFIKTAETLQIRGLSGEDDPKVRRSVGVNDPVQCVLPWARRQTRIFPQFVGILAYVVPLCCRFNMSRLVSDSFNIRTGIILLRGEPNISLVLA